jgi:hypothetical protein
MRARFCNSSPALVMTNATNLTVPVLQLQGYANEELASLTFDLTNANGAVSNQPGYMTGAIFNTNTLLFTNDAFKCFDLALEGGLNRVTLHAADLAGNVTTSNFIFNLNYSNKAAPVLRLYWPQNGAQIGGGSFTCRGGRSDGGAVGANQRRGRRQQRGGGDGGAERKLLGGQHPAVCGDKLLDFDRDGHQGKCDDDQHCGRPIQCANQH